MHSTVRPPSARRSGQIALALLTAAFVVGPVRAATIVVDDLSDPGAADALCTLREAISAANDDLATDGCPAGGGADRIEFAITGAITLASSLPLITEDLTIAGPGILDLTIDGDDLYRPIDVGFGAGTVELLDLTLLDGYASASGGCVRVEANATAALRRTVVRGCVAGNGGGGVYLENETATYSADLTIEDSSLHDNEGQGPASGGGVRTGIGSVVELRRTTFSSNRTTDASGHGAGASVIGSASVIVDRCTFSGNTADGNGGGLSASASLYSPVLTVTSSTFTGNTAGAAAGTLHDGGGIFVSPGVTATLGNTIVAQNVDSGTLNAHHDVSGIFVTLGYNLVGDNTGAAASFPDGAPNGNGDTVGTSGSEIDPMLGALAINGGFGLTHLPLLDLASPIVDAGNCFGEIADQRRFHNPATLLRIVDSAAHVDADVGCDIGAVERGATAPPADWIFGSNFESNYEGWSDVVGPAP